MKIMWQSVVLQLKEVFRNHNIEISGDNTHIHIAKKYSINDFGKGIETRCSVRSIEYTDEMNNTRKSSLPLSTEQI